MEKKQHNSHVPLDLDINATTVAMLPGWTVNEIMSVQWVNGFHCTSTRKCFQVVTLIGNCIYS